MPSFLPYGKAEGRQVPSWQGFEVAYEIGTLAAVVWVAPSDFCNDGVDIGANFKIFILLIGKTITLKPLKISVSTAPK